MDFVTEMLEEAIDYNAENGSDQDADLLSLEADLRAAAHNDTAIALAKEIRRYLIANGYADEDELTQPY